MFLAIDAKLLTKIEQTVYLLIIFLKKIYYLNYLFMILELKKYLSKLYILK